MVLWYFLQILSAGYEEVVEEAVVMDDTLNQSEQPDYTQVRLSIIHLCLYSGAQIILIKIREIFVWIRYNVGIIHTSNSMAKHAIVHITIVRVIQYVQIREGQIIRTLL